jgi:hypothetical protein
MRLPERGTGTLLAELAATGDRLRRAKRLQKRKRKPRTEKSRKRVGVTYCQRSKALRAIGFDSYEKYLASELWAGIRAKAIARHGAACILCRSGARLELHHNRYDVDTLLGASLRFVVPLCSDCHEAIEFENSQKIPMGMVIQRFYIRVRQFAVPIEGRTWQ